MSGNLSDFSEALLLKWLLTDQSATRPDQWFLALYTATPSDAGGGTECADSGYSRQEVSFGTDGASNDADLTFGPFDAEVTITHGGVFDADDNLLCWAALSGGAKTVPAGDSLRFSAGTVTASFD